MKRSSIGVVLVLASLACASVGHAAPLRSETKPYNAVSGDAQVSGPLPGGALNDCSGSDMSIGGSCFVIKDGDASVRVTAKDANTAKVCGELFWSSGPDATYQVTNLGSPTYFVGSTAAVAVPPGAGIAWVGIYQATGAVPRDVGSAKCFSKGSSGPGTTGTITVDVAGK